MPDRRRFMKSLSSLPLLGAQPSPARDYWQELGIRPFLNAAGTFTTLTASLMPPQVMEAMNYASRHFVHLPELQEAAGRRIAQLIGCEAAMVTSGAASALTCATAACITGKDPKKILALPDTTGLRNEVLIQRSHRYAYDHAVRAAGVHFVEVETADQLTRAAGPRTAMLLFFNDANARGQIRDQQFAELGRKLAVPTLNDAAADVPPVENLSKYTRMGFDLVAFSGGKGLRGPQSAGLLLGRRDLIEAARLNTSPYSDTLARGQKVNKEEILGMLAAVELYLKTDHAAEWQEWERRAKVIRDAVAQLPSVQCEVKVPEIANHTPHLYFTWDPSRVKLTYAAAARQLLEGTPSIETTPGNKDALVMTVWMLAAGEAEIVARRLHEVLTAAV
jgi:L-seryl-tRNA(Ser) seleniumtransferase